jgi:hypothetical protein
VTAAQCNGKERVRPSRTFCITLHAHLQRVPCSFDTAGRHMHWTCCACRPPPGFLLKAVVGTIIVIILVVASSRWSCPSPSRTNERISTSSNSQASGDQWSLGRSVGTHPEPHPVRICHMQLMRFDCDAYRAARSSSGQHSGSGGDLPISPCNVLCEAHERRRQE